MLERLYLRTLALAGHSRAPAWLAGISFAESSVFPIPPDALLVPMALARPDRAWRLAWICTVASVLGGALGYAIGFFLFETVALPVLNTYGYGDAVIQFEHWFERWGAAVVLVKGLTPLPYKVATLAAGAAKMDFALFVLTSFVARGARFFLVAALVRLFGPSVRSFIEKRLALVTTAAAVALVLGFVALRFL
jgi:membrane protein YqaA with SNARE-associated domain